MRNLEREQQLFLGDWSESQEDKPPQDEAPILERDEKECSMCGDSGPCSACERGIALAQAQGNPYRKKRK